MTESYVYDIYDTKYVIPHGWDTSGMTLTLGEFDDLQQRIGKYFQSEDRYQWMVPAVTEPENSRDLKRNAARIVRDRG